jgi:prepilin-type N-terminal cleavage/methylation domain-containing protein
MWNSKKNKKCHAVCYVRINSQSAIRNPQSHGFTLMEIIITLVVIAIAAVGVLSVFSMGMKGSANPLLVTQAAQLAQGEMDHVIGIKRASGFSAATIGAGTGQVCKTPMLPGFNCSLDICYVPTGDVENVSACATVTTIKRVAVTINNSTIGNITAVTLLTSY